MPRPCPASSPRAGSTPANRRLPRGYLGPSRERRRGDEEVSLAWVSGQQRTFTELYPEFETTVERLATWLARADDDDD